MSCILINIKVNTATGGAIGFYDIEDNFGNKIMDNVHTSSLSNGLYLSIAASTTSLRLTNFRTSGNNYYCYNMPDIYTVLLLHLAVDLEDSSYGFPNFMEKQGSTLSSNSYNFRPKSYILSRNSGTTNGLETNRIFLKTSDNDDWILGNTFSIDFWANPAFRTDSGGVVLCQYGTGGDFSLVYLDRNSSSTNSLGIRVVVGGNPVFWIGCTILSVSSGWHHYAIVRVNGGGSNLSWRLFIDGVAQTVSLVNGSYSGVYPNISGPLYIGTSLGIDNDYSGYLQEIRISKGIARWTNNFTPPTIPY